MYSLSDLKYALNYPDLAMRELNRFWHTRLFSRDYNTDGDDFMDEDWDNLVILDACRYDMFEEVNGNEENEHRIEGQLGYRFSKGSATIGFMKGNFDGREFHDTVYVTANPQLEWNRDKIDTEFFKVINLWEDEEAWSEKHHTVLPEEVTKRALEVAEEYPNKRLLVHYMQPHTPFLPENTDEEGPLTPYIYFHRIMEGEIEADRDDTWWMYLDNLRRAMPHVKELVENLEGRTVVTSDHGNMVGERSFPIPVKEWGHPNRTFVPKLVKVPWLMIEGERRNIIEGEPEEQEDSEEDEKVKEKLRGLGYL
ncbi:MAG: hypothetical protein ABEJ98_03960, partial [Candidatus Nanohaloarchaea archaeon]